jgi:Secretion system C-terminal sorting domain
MIGLIIMLVTLAGFVPASADYGINQNFFAFDGGSTPITLSGSTGPLSPGFPNVMWNDPGTNIDLTMDAHIHASPPYSVSCGVGFGEVIIPKHAHGPLSVLDSSIDSCQAWIYYAQQNYASIVTAPSAVDTMEHYIETCATTDSEYLNGIGLLWRAAGWAGGSGFWQPLRTWLESVMNRDKSQEWLCGILGDIQNTYEYQDPEDYNDAVAVLDYEICCSPCITHDSAYESEFWRDRAMLRNNEDLVFGDTVHDSILTPIDTSEPTMHDLGLDSLVQYFGELGVQNASAENIITNPSAYPNPTGDGTVISFGTTKEAYVIIALYNVLGQQAASQGFQNMMQPGNHEVPISLQGLPSGTYYARIQTSFGIQTVKLVKE